MKIPRAMRDICRTLEADGITIVIEAHNRHYRGRARRGDVEVNIFMPSSPSDHRAYLNTAAQIRRKMREAEGARG